MRIDNSSGVISTYYNAMIVDDSTSMRNLIKTALESNRSIKVVKQAENGLEAIKALTDDSADIDLIILDHQMPIMDGLEALPKLLVIKPQVKIIMVSFSNSNFAIYTKAALTLGASDYLEKPNNNISVDLFTSTLLNKIFKLFGKDTNNISQSSLMLDPGIKTLNEKLFDDSNIVLKSYNVLFKPEVIAIASSTGGPRALMEVLGNFSNAFINSKIFFITQHIKKDFVDLLVGNLNSLKKFSCKIGQEGEEAKPGHVYIAPSDKHMEILKKGLNFTIHLSDEPPQNFCKPSADPMFISLAKISNRVLGVVLTGIGNDGAFGAKKIAENGGVIVAQDKETSVVWGMPGAAANLGVCSAVLPLHKISNYIEKSFY